MNSLASYGDVPRYTGRTQPIHQEVCTVTQEIDRENSQAPARMAPIGETEYALIVQTAHEARPREKPQQAALRGAVDIAAIGLMRDCLLRPQEAAAARWCHLQREEDGSGRLAIPSSKTAPSAICYVSARTMNALDEMRSTKQALGTDDTDARIFQMNGQTLSRHIRNACSFAGLEGRYDGNSPRLGMAMDLTRANYSLVMIMQAGRWKGPQMSANFIRNIPAGHNAVANWHQQHPGSALIE